MTQSKATDKQTEAELAEFYRRNPEYEGAAKLWAVIDKRRRQPNILSLDEFEEFLILYQKPPEIEPGDPAEFAYAEKIEKLTIKYKEKVNLFKWTIVVADKSNPVPIPGIPPMPPVFVSFADPVMDDRAEMMTKQFRTNLQSDIPAVQDRADAISMEELKRAHNTPENTARIQQVRRATIQALDAFKVAKAKLATGGTGAVPQTGTSRKVTSDTYNNDYASGTEMDFL